MTEELPARRQFPPRDPVPDDDPRYNHLARCGHWKGKNGDYHRRSDGSRCLGWVRKGTTTCDSHSGTDRETAGARSAIATTIRGALTYDGPVIDSGEIMLNASSAAWHRATTLTAELDRLYGEAGEGGSLRDVLVGNTYAITEAGDKVKTGEYIRALAQLEGQWWKMAFDMAQKVLAAKLAIADRRTAATERQAQILAQQTQAVLLDPRLALTPTQRAVLGDVFRDHFGQAALAA